jgi:hypothetical protein
VSGWHASEAHKAKRGKNLGEEITNQHHHRQAQQVEYDLTFFFLLQREQCAKAKRTRKNNNVREAQKISAGHFTHKYGIMCVKCTMSLAIFDVVFCFGSFTL